MATPQLEVNFNSGPAHRNTWRDAVWASDLPPMQRLVALTYADHSSGTGLVWVTTARGLERTGMARRTWMDQVTGLRKAGWLELVTAGRSGRDGGRAPEYRLIVPPGMSAGDAHIDSGMSAGDTGMSAAQDRMSAGDGTPTPAVTPTETPAGVHGDSSNGCSSVWALPCATREHRSYLTLDDSLDPLELADQVEAGDPACFSRLFSAHWDTLSAIDQQNLESDDRMAELFTTDVLDAYCHEHTPPSQPAAA